MGIAVILFLALVALWAMWVAYQVSKDGGYPPYQDSCTPAKQWNCDVQYDTKWPFPQEKP